LYCSKQSNANIYIWNSITIISGKYDSRAVGVLPFISEDIEKIVIAQTFF
jgi:hypothetical protein